MKKHNITACIACLITIGVAAQDPCTTYINSTYNGSGLSPTPTAYTSIGFNIFCDTINADQGFYKYLDNQIDPIPNSWADDDIYGLQGRGLVHGMVSNAFLEADVFETKLVAVDGPSFQTIENPEFTFASGKFRFNRLVLDANTVVNVLAGTTIDVTGIIDIKSNAILNIEEGATVTMTPLTPTKTTVIRNKYGTINGNVTKTFNVLLNANVTANQTDLDEVRFVLNTGMYDINMDELIRDIQTQLVLSTVKPNVQVSYLLDDLDDESYAYAADQAYYDYTQSLIAPSEAASGFASQDHTGFVSFGATHLRAPAVLYNEYFVQNAIYSLPIYDAGSNTVSELLLNPQLNGLQGGQITTTDAEQDSISRLPSTLRKALVVNVVGASSVPSKITFNVTGKPFNNNVVKIKNDLYSLVGYGFGNASASPSYEEYPAGYSPYFAVANQTGTNWPLTYGTSLSTYKNTTALDQYRAIDFTGLNQIASTQGSQISMQKLVDKIISQAPTAALAFYDLKPLFQYMPNRVFATGPTASLSYNKHAANSYPLKVAQYLSYKTNNSSTYKTIDMYNIPGMEHPNRLGTILEAYDMVGYNYVNHMDMTQFDGSAFEFPEYKVSPEYTYSLQNGSNTYFPSNFPLYGDSSIMLGSAMSADIYDDNSRELKEYKTELPVITYPYPRGEVASTSTYPNPTRQELDDANVLTMLRLSAITSTDDTITIALLPMAFGDTYSSEPTYDRFVTSVAPDPAMYIVRENDTGIGRTRFGAYARNSNCGITDTLSLVIDFDAINFDTDGITVSKYILDTPITQDPNANSTWPGYWHYVAKNGSDAAQKTFDPAFEIEITNTAQTLPKLGGVAGTESFNGDLVTITMSSLFGDFNNDGTVSTSDLLIFLGFYGNFNASSLYDVDNNGVIGAQDLTSLFTEFGATTLTSCGGTEPILQPLAPRMKHLAIKKTSTPADYNWKQHPDFTAAESAYLLSNPTSFRYVITDEYGIIISSGTRRAGVSSFIRLPQGASSTAELIASNTAVAGQTPGYNVHFSFERALKLPGATTYITTLCLGCNYSGAPYPTKPVFTAN